MKVKLAGEYPVLPPIGNTYGLINPDAGIVLINCPVPLVSTMLLELNVPLNVAAALVNERLLFPMLSKVEFIPNALLVPETATGTLKLIVAPVKINVLAAVNPEPVFKAVEA